MLENKRRQHRNTLNLSTGALKLLLKFQIPRWMLMNAPLDDQQNRNTGNNNRQPDCGNKNTTPPLWRRFLIADIDVSAPKCTRPNLSDPV